MRASDLPMFLYGAKPKDFKLILNCYWLICIRGRGLPIGHSKQLNLLDNKTISYLTQHLSVLCSFILVEHCVVSLMLMQNSSEERYRA